MELEHEGACVLFRQRDVDPLLKSESIIGVQSAKVNDIMVTNNFHQVITITFF